jgi:ABC-type lipoprotein export system ATPase subunit
MPTLATQSLTYKYPSGKELTFTDFSYPLGTNILVLGKSGSGKTSLLHLLSGILTPSAGEVAFDDMLLNSLKPGEKDHFRGKNIGMIFQKHFFIQGISILENIKAACLLGGTRPDTSYIDNMLKQLNIHQLVHKKPDQLSEGEQQRFSVARAMANKPSWILADEPTSSLDDDNCRNFVELMNLSIQDKPVSWIIATHDNRLKNHFTQIYNL